MKDTIDVEEACGRLTTYEDFVDVVLRLSTSSVYAKQDKPRPLLGELAEAERAPEQPEEPAQEPEQEDPVSSSINARIAAIKGKGKGSYTGFSGQPNSQAQSPYPKGGGKATPKGDKGKGKGHRQPTYDSSSWHSRWKIRDDLFNVSNAVNGDIHNGYANGTTMVSMPLATTTPAMSMGIGASVTSMTQTA